MAGSSSIAGNQTVTFTDNMSFDGTDRGGAMTSDGQLWIGATASNRANDGGHVRLGNITSSDGSIAVTNGPGSIDITGQAAGFQPNNVLQEYDDFISYNTGGNISKLTWDNTGSAPRSIAGTAGNPGILSFGNQGAGNSGIYLRQAPTAGNQIDPIPIGAGTLTQSWVVQLDTLSGGGNTYRFSCGFADSQTISAGAPEDAFVDGIYFRYTDTVNSGNFQLICTSAGVSTTVNSLIPPTTAFTTLTISVNAAGTLASFYINNVLAGSTIATNIPTVSLTPMCIVVRTAGTNNVLNIDLYWIVLSLSNPRPGPISPAIAGTDGRLLLSYTATPISYQVLGTDAIIGVTSTAAARTITMPIVNLNVGQQWEIKDESGGAATNNITVSGNGFNIDGAATYVINTNYGSVSLYWSGSNFFLV